MIEDTIFDLSNQYSMNTYIALFTQPVTVKRVRLEIAAHDYLIALQNAHAYATQQGYRFDDLTFKSKVKGSK